MKQIDFLIQGSATEPYLVTVKVSPKKFNIYCNCPAGAIGQNCKHKMQIMQGGKSKIVSNNLQEISNIPKFIAESPLASAIEDLTQLEAQAEAIKAEISRRKKQIARLLSD